MPLELRETIHAQQRFNHRFFSKTLKVGSVTLLRVTGFINVECSARWQLWIPTEDPTSFIRFNEAGMAASEGTSDLAGAGLDGAD